MLSIYCVFRPLNSIGMPYFDSQLLSAWPVNLHPKPATYPPPAKIPPQILASMKYNQNIAYASLPKELRGRRNMTTAEPRKGGARFRSGKPSSDEVQLIFNLSKRTPKTFNSQTSTRSTSATLMEKYLGYTAALKSSIRSLVWRTSTLGE
jgi:hypothetical protein